MRRRRTAAGRSLKGADEPAGAMRGGAGLETPDRGNPTHNRAHGAICQSRGEGDARVRGVPGRGAGGGLGCARSGAGPPLLKYGSVVPSTPQLYINATAHTVSRVTP